MIEWDTTVVLYQCKIAAQSYISCEASSRAPRYTRWEEDPVVAVIQEMVSMVSHD